MSTPAQPNSSNLTRQELYEKVWMISMRKLAGEYGLSDVGLAKLCERHEIPKPPVGYWAKHEVGKAPPRPPLLPASNPSLEQIPLSLATNVQTPPAPPEPTDPEIVQMLARARALVVQPASPDTKLHPVAERTLRALEKAAKSGEPDRGCTARTGGTCHVASRSKPVRRVSAGLAISSTRSCGRATRWR